MDLLCSESMYKEKFSFSDYFFVVIVENVKNNKNCKIRNRLKKVKIYICK